MLTGSPSLFKIWRQYPHAILPVSAALCADEASSPTDITAYFLQGGCGSQHPPCLRALPHRGLFAGGGQTYGLMSCVKHGDISQTPVSERCRTLAIIVMGGSGRLNQQAGDLYYAPLYVSLIHTHIQQPTLCLSCQRSSDPRTGINGRKKSHCVARQLFFFPSCPTSHHRFIISSLSLQKFLRPSSLSKLHQHPLIATCL